MSQRQPVAIDIVSYETGKPVRTIEVHGKSEMMVARIDRGLQSQLDHERFYTRVRYEEAG